MALEGTEGAIIPFLSPDGDWIGFFTTDGALMKAPTGGGPPVAITLVSGDLPTGATWTSDGRIVFDGSNGLYQVSADGGTPEVLTVVDLTRDEFRHVLPRMLPGGAASDTGALEVYVQPYPGSGGRRQISTQGGMMPAWSPNGRELFYVAPGADDDGPSRLMAVDIVTEPALEPGRPHALFDWEYGTARPVRHYDVGPNGERFLVAAAQEGEPPPRTHVRLIQSWVEELKARAPIR